MRWSDGIINSMDMSLSKFQEIVKNREAKDLDTLSYNNKCLLPCPWVASSSQICAEPRTCFNQWSVAEVTKCWFPD